MVFGESPLKDLYRALIWGPWRGIASQLPATVEIRVHSQLGAAVSRLAQGRQHRVRDAMERAGVDPAASSRVFETHFANQYVGFSFGKIRRDTWSQYLQLVGVGHLDGLEGGAVIAHPHMGLPQVPLHVLGLLGYPVHQVGGGRTSVALSAIGARAADTRARLEERIAAELHDARDYVRPMVRTARAGGLVFTAVDGTGGGIELGRRVVRTVCGNQMKLPVFPAWLAHHAGVPLIPLHCYSRPGSIPLVAELGAPAQVSDVDAGVDVLASWLEGWLQAHPGDWHFWDAWHAGEGGLLVEPSAGR